MGVAQVERIVAVEKRVLTASIVVGGLLSLGILAVGLVGGMRILVFDGAFGVFDIAMSWLALHASRVAGSGPTAAFPFGRDAMAPLIVLAQGIAMAAMLVYAAADAVILIAHGGQRVDAVVVAIVAFASGLSSYAFAAWARRQNPGSDLLDAEAVAWRASGIRGLVAASAAVLAAIAAAASAEWALFYIDPVLVLVACALVVPMPVRLVRHGLNELLEGTPDSDTMRGLREVVAEVTQRFDLPEPGFRATKLGLKAYVDVVYVTTEPRATLELEDDVRRAIAAGFDALPLDVWATVQLTRDAALEL
ncbi:cation transporter [Microbacterium ulmi]|uniref:Cation transporter n=1 Tax=Microbacterium ulmi TaxID=179095 RepID=A0A7Y2M3L4_9MICO|nr:cation transporter [Microbacterium ulmi]NII70484.1 putative Co/Zn/Cd cation transporter (cation efflux family) [Microbacterium ulmi]NNH04473.1 cation transporter [Microbacterium ulmi]